MTDKKFPGNPTRSYRGSSSLRIPGEVTDWTRLEPSTDPAGRPQRPYTGPAPAWT